MGADFEQQDWGWGHGNGGELALAARVGGRGAVPPGATVFVFHIPTPWDEEELARHFTHCGRIVSCALQRNTDGTSRGFGFVGFDCPSGARKARIGMDRFHSEGKFLAVQTKKGEEQYAMAIPHYPPSGKPGLPQSRGARAPHGATVFVFYLPPTWTEAELCQHFSHCGTILDVQVMKKGSSTESRGFGFVGYEHPASAGRAVEGMMGFKTAEGKFLKTSHKKGEDTAWAGQMVLPGHHLASRPAIKVPPPDRHRGNYAAAAGTQELGQAPLLDETVVKNTHETAVQAIQAVLGEALNLERTIPTESWSQYIEHGVQLAAEVAVQQAFHQHEESPLATAPVPVDHRRHREAPPQASLKAVPPGANLYIFYVPANWSEDELQDHFGPFGNILSLTVARHADGQSRGFAFVGYDDPASATTAIEALNGFKTPEGRILQVALKGGARSSPY